jgi:hypothetical protein
LIEGDKAVSASRLDRCADEIGERHVAFSGRFGLPTIGGGRNDIDISLAWNELRTLSQVFDI